MKRIKMVIYGEPGVGKSVFASKAPKPFFICTDGNYEWLEDFGADPNAHANCGSWAEIKNLILKPSNFENYETIVLDLTEDAFKWCEQEYCVRQHIDHLSDLGYGKAYDATRTEFFVDICKLFAMDKNIILIMHGTTFTVKDRRGVEHTKHGPSNRLPDKLIDQIEGRVRYFLRCYVKDIEFDDGTVLKQRFLSLVPKPNEFGIIRGVDETKVPQDIPLDWNEFVKAIGYNVDIPTKVEESNNVEEPKRRRRKRTEEEQEDLKKIVESGEAPKEMVQEVFGPAITVEEEPAPWEDSKEEVKEEPKEEVKEEPILSSADKVAAMRAKLAAMKK